MLTYASKRKIRPLR
jgi:hypothetical protein